MISQPQQLQQKAIATMMALNAAVRNVRLYPATSSLTINSVEKANQAIMAVLENEETLIFAESERKLLVCEQSLSKKDREKPQVILFEEMMLNFRIRSIAFHRGLEKAELEVLLSILKNDPEDPENAEAIKELFERDDMPHIDIDEKVYVAFNEDYEVLARKDQNRGRIIKETFVPMVETLDGILDDSNKELVSSQLAKSMAAKDDDALSMVLTQKYDNELGASLFNKLLNLLADDKFERLMNTIKDMVDELAEESEKDKGARKAKKDSKIAGLSDEEKEAVLESYQNMLDSDKGERVKVILRAREERVRIKEERDHLHVKDGINRIFQGDPTIFRDEQVMAAVPDFVDGLVEKNKEDSVEKLLDNVSAALSSQKEIDRRNAAKALAEVGERLVKGGRLKPVLKLAPKTIQWIVSEDQVSDELEKICNQLKIVAERLLKKGKFSLCAPIAEMFHRISSGEASKDASFVDLADKILTDMVSPDATETLLTELQTNASGNRDQAIPLLVHLGKSLVEPLLDALSVSADKFERIRIVRALSDIGKAALPAVEQRTMAGGAKEYVGALLAVLGRIGTKDQVEFVSPYLSDKDPQTRREALNTICQIGGDRRGPALLSALDSADDSFKIDLVAMIGGIHESSAVPELLKLLKTKSLLSSKNKNELDEKICIALGKIGSFEALPELESLARQKKGLLKIKSTPENVRAAAERAISMIRKKEWSESEPDEVPAYSSYSAYDDSTGGQNDPSEDAKLSKEASGENEKGNVEKMLDVFKRRKKKEAAVELDQEAAKLYEELNQDSESPGKEPPAGNEATEKKASPAPEKDSWGRTEIPGRKKPPNPTMDFVTKIPGSAPSKEPDKKPGKKSEEKKKSTPVFEAVTKIPMGTPQNPPKKSEKDTKR